MDVGASSSAKYAITLAHTDVEGPEKKGELARAGAAVSIDCLRLFSTF